MSSEINDSTRDVLARSLPLLHQHRERLVDAIAATFPLADSSRRTQASVTASLLTELLLEQARNIAEFGAVGRLDGVAAEHSAAGIGRRDYAAYGDVLVPILRDLLPTEVPPKVTSIWSDTYWEIIRKLPKRTRLAA